MSVTTEEAVASFKAEGFDVRRGKWCLNVISESGNPSQTVTYKAGPSQPR